MARGEHLRGAGGVAHPVVEATGAGVAGILVGVGRGGCQSPVEHGDEATTAVAMRGWHHGFYAVR